MASTQTHIHKDYGYLTPQGDPWFSDANGGTIYRQFVTSDMTVVNLDTRTVSKVERTNVLGYETGMIMAD